MRGKNRSGRQPEVKRNMNAIEHDFVVETLAQELDVRTPCRESSPALNRSLVREFLETHPRLVSDAVTKATMDTGELSPFVLTKHLLPSLETHAQTRLLPPQS
mgnify:CR=1 FL=1